MYLERLSVFSDTNPYYRSKTFNKGLNTDLDIPNCTQFAVCRSYEACEVDKPFVMFRNRSAGSYPNAKNFFEDSILPKGYDLKEGSIAVFDGNFGHVAFVEQVIDKNHAIISQSQYSSNKSRRDYMYFEKREVELTVGKATLSGIGKLIGFVYLPIKEIRVSRDVKKEQILIKEEMVNVRIEPEGDVFAKGLYCPMGLFDVLDSKEVNGYVWYELEPNHWVREGGWSEYYPKEDYNEELMKENETLKELNRILTEKIDRIEKIIEE